MATQQNDEQIVLGIFAEEVWCKILVRTMNAVDYHNISSASPFFRTLLLPRANLILIPSVVKIVVKQVPAKTCLRKKAPDEVNQNRVSLLTLREVSRAFRNAVDIYLQAQDFPFQSDYVLRIGADHTFTAGHNWLYEDMQIEQQFVNFQQHFDNTHLVQKTNPFLSRGITLKISGYDAENLEPYYNSCVRFLQKFGYHIWYCEINTDGPRPRGEVRLYSTKLQTMLRFMPNLKALIIHGHSGVLNEQVNSLELGNNGIQMPRLEQLHTLRVWLLPYLLIQELLQSNPQVRQVDAWSAPQVTKLCLELLPKMSAGAFFLINENEDFFPALESSKPVKHVKSLRVNLTNMTGVPWETIFRTVESKFSTNLIQLQLQLPMFNEFVGTAQGLTLPILKILELKIHHPVAFDFLLPLKDTLEQLYIDYQDPVYRRGQLDESSPLEEEYQYRFLGEPIQYGIWNHFPNLKFLKTQTWKNRGKIEFSCNRDDWAVARLNHKKLLGYYRSYNYY